MSKLQNLQTRIGRLHGGQVLILVIALPILAYALLFPLAFIGLTGEEFFNIMVAIFALTFALMVAVPWVWFGAKRPL